MLSQLTLKQRILIAVMLFGLFFGAGNIIFPVYLGQILAEDVLLASIGFTITAVGIPLLSIIAIGYSESESVFQLANRVSPLFAYFFTIALYLTIGPLFAIPRLATVSFEVGMASHLATDQQDILLAIYSALFFAATLYFALRPSSIIETVGKYLTPLFIVLISIILIMGLFDNSPLINQTSSPDNALAVGFLEGYNTMDGLAGLAFGIVIIHSIRSYGINQPSVIAKEVLISGTLSAIIMMILYIGLILLGRQSLAFTQISANGGIALSEITQHYLGMAGQILLALTMIVACLKTAIGLVVALSETFSSLFKQTSQQFWAIIACITAFLIANLGLTTIIQLSIPILLFLYPLAIVLIIASFLNQHRHFKFITQTTLIFTGITAFFDLLNASPAFITNTSIATGLIDFASLYLPGFQYGLGWIIPALIGFLLAHLIVRFKKA